MPGPGALDMTNLVDRLDWGKKKPNNIKPHFSFAVCMLPVTVLVKKVRYVHKQQQQQTEKFSQWDNYVSDGRHHISACFQYDELRS